MHAHVRHACMHKMINLQASTCSSAREIAEAARGCQAAGIDRLASLGAHGAPGCQQNMRRDLFRFARRALGVPWDCFLVNTVTTRRGRLAGIVSRRPVLLPHECLGWIWRHRRNEFKSIMGTEHVVEFWRHIASAANRDPAKMAWFVQSPFRKQILERPDLWIPGKVFGDDTGLGRSRGLSVLHWSSAVAEDCTPRSRMPMMVQGAHA